MQQTQFNYNDGGRKDAGYLGTTGDCGVRAIAIVTGLPYQKVYDMVNDLVKSGKGFKQRKTGRTSNARTGVWRKDVNTIMTNLGWKWNPTMFIGQGCKVHLRADELPKGKILCNVSRHYVAVIDGVVNDIYDSSRNGNRCVYGYYSYTGKPIIETKPEPKKEAVAVAKPNKANEKLEKLLASKKRWETKAKRAETALKKLDRKIKYYSKKAEA